MAKIPVVVNELASDNSPRTCVTHGSTMNCPTQQCPGVPRPSYADKGDARKVNVGVLTKAIENAVAEYVRVEEDCAGEFECEVNGRPVTLIIE